MRLKIFLVVLILVLVNLTYTKRSRGGSRRGSSSGGSFWNRKSKSSSTSEQKHVPTQTKPVAASQPKPAVNQAKAKEPELKKENANVQQSGRPIGWDVNNSPNKAANAPPPPYSPYPHNSGSYPHGVYSSGYHNSPGYGGGHYGNPGQVGGYGGYPQQSGMGGNGGYPQQSGYGGYPHQSGYGGYPQQSGYGGYPHQSGMVGGYGGYPHQGGMMGGYGGYPNQGGMMGGYGGYGGYPQQSGMMGSMFGGNKHGLGYGGLGGVGSMAAYGYGMKKSGGFFGKHAFRNVLGGLFVWYLVSGLIRTPYKVYNFHNLPNEKREEITLPTNVLTLCNENATNICVPGTTALCTLDNKILCVTTMSSATPCQDVKGELCVNSTIPCLDANDPLCQNRTTSDNTTTVNLPCFTNMTLDTSIPTNVTLPASEDNKFCVTVMAEPDPSKPPEEIKETEIEKLPHLSYVERYASQFPDDEYSAENKTYRLSWTPSGSGRYGDPLMM